MFKLLKGIIVLSTVIGMALVASPAANATSNQPSCVDGNVRSNLAVTWKTNGSVTVGTVNNKPLCSDTTLHFSSYTMPNNYNGQPFNNNPTASPQSIFDTTSVVLKKDATTPVAMKITLPEACKNIQVDVYYGPKITTVTEKGHGSQYITGKILVKTEKVCAPVVPETPVTPVEAQTPPTPAPQVIVTPVAAVELPRTGLDLLNTLAIGSVVSAATYAAVYTGMKRR
ncbi:MAG: hypothetical protein JWO54_569 [Candidatus Saccharibacteria bacterium]|nr:hypothetical protein [Candidatus Saccharibacteria bacterium]MDB5180770.1 hypothetical protein [Candidatus Saccharibacteria bacterium]MDB5180809.1 hypothetical protein [Candidatus Saccharibacteria bacterium]